MNEGEVNHIYIHTHTHTYTPAQYTQVIQSAARPYHTQGSPEESRPFVLSSPGQLPVCVCVCVCVRVCVFVCICE